MVRGDTNLRDVTQYRRPQTEILAWPTHFCVASLLAFSKPGLPVRVIYQDALCHNRSNAPVQPRSPRRLRLTTHINCSCYGEDNVPI